MASLIVAPSVDEWREGQADYQSLIAALEQEGFEARLQEPRGGRYGAGGFVTDPLIEVSLFLAEHVSKEAIGAIVALTIDHLRRARRRRRKSKPKGVVYGPDGEVVHTFDLAESERRGGMDSAS